VIERFNSGLELVERIVSKRMRGLPSYIERDDLVSAGREGLLKAARNYDPTQGSAFHTYAGYRINGALFDYVRQNSALPRYVHKRFMAFQAAAEFSEGELPALSRGTTNPKAGIDGTAEKSFDERLEAMAIAAALRLRAKAGDPATCEVAAPGDDPEEALGKFELLARIRLLLDTMEAEDELPKDEREILRRHYYEGTSLTDIARDMGLDKSWVSRQHTRAVTRLARHLRDHEFI
jgi:RNA polymerase sigma factor for flagellar operon FliA